MWLFLVASINALLLTSFVLLWPEQKIWLGPVVIVLTCALAYVLHREAKSRRLIINKLNSGFASLKDNDFSVSLPLEQDTQHNELIESFNRVADSLRTERQALYQRELLLDKMVNASNTVSILLNPRDQLVYLNLAARQLLPNYKQLIGLDWQTAMTDQAVELKQVLNKTSGVISLASEETPERDWLLSTHFFKLHGATHKLILLKPITNALQAQETQVWKKVIRVINHELNNSLAPISSMCHSGNILAQQLDNAMLNKVFDTISGRINKLSEFIDSYSRLARISQPQLAEFELIGSLRELQQLYPFELTTDMTTLTLTADPAQLEQVLINLIKNAREANQQKGVDAPVAITLQASSTEVTIAISDSGTGMNEDQFMRAFLPSFTTKPNGSGIGLPICKEIIDKHQGAIELTNRPAGGLTVKVSLPLQANNYDA